MERTTMHSRDVFVDVGKSGIRLRCCDDGHPLVAESSSGISPASGGDQGEVLVSEVLILLSELGVESITNIVIGSTAELTASERHKVATELQQVFPTATVGITDDGTLAHARYLDAAGVLMAVGTGVIVISRDRHDVLRRRDGWGPLLGDRGGAVSVGLAAIRASFTSVDDQEFTALRGAVESVFGVLGVHTARDITSRSDWPVAVAGLAPLVCALAADGDPDAMLILDDAADEAVNTVRRAADIASVTDVMILGRFGSSDQVARRISPRLRDAGLTMKLPDMTRHVAATVVLEGAYRPWVHVHAATT